MLISVKLAGPLRETVQGHDHGELRLELAAGTTVAGAVEAMGLEGRVRMLLLNGRPLLHDQELKEGDRLFLLPPELAYNMYVATGFLSPMAREEIRRQRGDD